MNDDFMNSMRRDPDPGFTGRLRERLRAREEADAGRRAPWRPVLALAAAAAVVAALFAFPSVRASAQAVLDVFRVRNFAAVEFDPARLEQLRMQEQGEGLLGFGRTEVVKEPGKPQEVPTLEAAGALAGIDVRSPSGLPDGLALRRVTVQDAAEARLTADAAKLRALLETLDIRDLEVPPGIDGRTITVRKPPIVVQEYGNDRAEVTVLQARSPEVDLPAGVDLGQLAEIGMRIIGVDAAEARRLARSLDWNGTLLVPVPMNATSFRRVEVHGQPGLLVTTRSDPPPGSDARRQRSGTMVMWSEGGRVFAVAGPVGDLKVMQIAESVR